MILISDTAGGNLLEYGGLSIDAFLSLTLAILLLFMGKGMVARVRWLRRYGIPEPVVGGVLCAALVCVLYYTFGLRVEFSLGARDMLLLYFFAALGLNSNVRMLFSGGRMLAMLVMLAVSFIVIQNALGMGLASLYGMDPRAGLMVGSISLTGGVGTTLAWTPYFTEVLDLPVAEELGLAANMVGMVSACVIGGPIAGWLIRRHQVKPSTNDPVEVGASYDKHASPQLDYYGVLLAVFWLNIALMLGRGVGAIIELTGLHLPAFVGCLMAGILMRSLGELFLPHGGRLWRFDIMKPGIALISDISLGLFLTMALMGLQLWALQPILGFISLAMALQITLVVVFTVLVVFRAMGRDYDAAVVCSAFGGIALGSTATAVANMSAVTRQYGASPRAFLIVPLVCGFFIDLANALVVSLMVR